MHVKRICVLRYGPLKPFDGDMAPFTVIQGPNERGKTLLIDALVRMLFKDHLKRGQYKLFGNLSRVDERPEGFVVMATHAGETNLGADKSLADVSGVEITPEDFRNVFLIRDSDLRIRDQHEYYGRVSEKLCGTRSTAIESLKDALKRMGRLRSARPDSPLAVRKDRDHRRIGEQVAAAEKLIDRMADLGVRLERERFDEATRRLADLTDRRAALENEQRRLRAAETRERLHGARAAVDAARKDLAALSLLGKAADEPLENWRALLVRRDVFEKELGDTLARGGDLRAAREQATADWEGMRAVASEKSAMRARVEDELRPLLERHRTETAVREHAERAMPAVIGVLAASVVLGVVAVVAVLTTRSPIAVGAGVACVAAGVWSGIALARGARGRARLSRKRAAILAVASRLGLAAASVDEVVEAVETLERDATRLAERAREAEVLMRQRETDVAANDSAAGDKRARIVETQSALEAARVSTGCENVEQLEAAVAQRRSLENGINTRLTLLRSWLPGAARASDREGFLRACDAEIMRGLADLPAETGDGDPEAARRVEQELAGVSVDERNLRQELDRARQDLRAVEVRVADLGALEGPVHCRTTRELSDTQRRLVEFCETVQRDARLAKEAIRIVQEIEIEENEKVGELFGDGTLVSRWFREITGGAYRAVHLEEGDVLVEQNDGRRLSASALSGGTFDQLYLAIRASIAERMLPESKGFFILDDPFLKADRDRMRALMKMLRHLVERGWQVIYVTAKDEVVEALRADIAARSVHLIELEHSLFSRSTVRTAPDLSDAPRLL